MSGFKRLDFLNNCATNIDTILSISDSASFIFNIMDCDSGSKKNDVFNALFDYLKSELKEIEKEDISIVDLGSIVLNNLSPDEKLTKVSMIDCSSMSDLNIGVLSNYARKLKQTKNMYIFNFTNKQHLSLSSGFEPFQFRDRVFFNLDEDLLKVMSYKELIKVLPKTKDAINKPMKVKI